MPNEIEKGHVVVEVENVSVIYQRAQKAVGSFKEMFVQLLTQKAQMHTIRALNGVSMTIQRGEVYGIIGRNGSGKSTMLKALSRIIRPTTGRIQIWGKVSPLLGVGAGFHPELSGRENVYLYSTLLGRTIQQTKELFDSIVEFAELEDFMEEPIRIYSSGMVSRLGFAVAMATRPEILLVDEVLSVGDERFKDRCNERFQEFCQAGTTIIFVSHNLGAVKEMCSRVTWLNQGISMMTGPTNEILPEYQKHIRSQQKSLVR